MEHIRGSSELVHLVAEFVSQVPEIRIRVCNAAAARDEREFVLYCMTAFRRTRWNFPLDRAVEWGGAVGQARRADVEPER